MLTMDEFLALFEHVERGAWRLLTLDNYNVTDAERARLRDWKQTGRVPDRAGEPWLEMVKGYRSSRIPFARVHVFPAVEALTPYCEYVLNSYKWNDDAGERVGIADRSLHPQLNSLDQDFWMIDGAVIVLNYDEARAFVGAHRATADEAATRLEQQRLAEKWAVPLAEYVTYRRERLSA